MRHNDRNIHSVGEYITELRNTAQDGLVWFRGQTNLVWPLLPNIARPINGYPDGPMNQELPALKRFKQNADAFLARVPRDDWEWIFLMQHHRGLTRLLDWTESPLVALYFALGGPDADVDAVVWCLDPMELNRKSGHRRRFDRDVLAFGIDDVLNGYLPDRVGDNQGAELLPVAAIGPRNSTRMIAQSGTFTIMHSQRMAVEDVPGQDHVWRLVIPAGQKASLRAELRLLGFNEFLLFPELETLAMHTREMFR
jgi:hypothetical protein